MDFKNKKCLTAYFSRSGKNYVNGDIIDIEIGNTESAAKIIQQITGSELYQIKTIYEYPYDYTKATEIAQKEKRENKRPELSEQFESIECYDIILLGYPNWWGTMPMAVFTFLEKYDFSGKTIIPFCTHEGSGMGQSENDIIKLCPNSKIIKGLQIKGSNVNNSEKDIVNWLDDIKE